MSTLPATGHARAWAWVAHLRAGGTTPWQHWTASGDEVAGHGRFLPGAQQLELLRRLNQRGTPAPPVVERVLAASAPGRGRPDLELAGLDQDRRFGPPAVDPAELPEDELIRVATGLIAEDLVAVGEPRPAVMRRPRRWRTRYQLAGDPWLAAPLTDALRADGRPPGGAGRAVHVLGTDLATMLTHAWLTGTFAEGGPSWPDFLARLQDRDRVPRRVDLVTIAERWRDRPHVGSVDVVLDLAALRGLLGVRRLPAGAAPVAAHASELSRRTAAALGMLVTPPRQKALLAGVLRARLADVPGAPPRLPAEHRDWVEEAARRMRARLLRGGYPVVGDPDLLLPGWAESPVSRGNRNLSGVATPDQLPKRPTSSGVAEADVLDLALELLLRPVTGPDREEEPS